MVKNGSRLLTAGLFVFGFTFSAFPLATDDAGMVGQGEFEVEAAADYWTSAAAFGLGIAHGITSRMDVGLNMGRRLLPEEESAIEGAELGLKIALVPDLVCATFSGVFGDPCYCMNLVLSKSMGRIALNANMGGTMVAATKDADLTYACSGAVTTGLLETGMEIGGTQEGLNWWQLGTSVSMTSRIVADVGIGGDFEKDVDLTATTGLRFAFPFSHAEEKKGE